MYIVETYQAFESRTRWLTQTGLKGKELADVFHEVETIVGRSGIQQLLFTLQTSRKRIKYTVVRGDELSYADLREDFRQAMKNDRQETQNLKFSIDIEPDPHIPEPKEEQKEEEDEEEWDFQI